MSEAKRARLDPEAVAQAEQDNFEDLEKIQEDIEGLNDRASEEVLEIEKKYNGLRRPLFKKRSAILRKIPNFWGQAILHHEMLAEMMEAKDREVLKHLVELDVEDFDDLKSGYKITFTFSENPYFSNKTLSKEFRYTQEGELEVTPTPIQWKPGMDITKRGDSEDDDESGGKRGREEKESFFKWFDAEDQEVELGDIIKEDLWPNPVKYYTDVRNDDDDDEQGEEEEDDEGEEQS
mmetsp:Transcript_15144/g.25936  ORF Transcript_15144/g.25936 Transcript_15144/m.25936 type:complete len:235 (+) Transcript_15144:38-742(+)